jgi:hypothetical protein
VKLMENKAIFQKLKATLILKMFRTIFLIPKKIRLVVRTTINMHFLR